MCTTLVYSDSNGGQYLGRTLELDVEEFYAIAYVPAGTKFETKPEGSKPLDFESKHPFIAIGSPIRKPTADDPFTPSDLKICEGINLAGLTCSMLAYPTAGGVEEAKKTTRSLIDASDLGTWMLSNFGTIDEVKKGLDEQDVFLTRIALVGNLPYPFHIVVHDNSGKAIVIEWNNGKMDVFDNPVGVMTNGPDFQWHLTNLANWTHLTNVDASEAKFGDLEVRQPDSGIATASLPSSNTSVGRFIKALFYSKFSEETSDPDTALMAVARAMNNFDRPRGITVDPKTGGEGMSFEGKSLNEGAPPTEYTSWTNLSDLGRGKFMVRTYGSFNYTSFDLNALADKDEVYLTLTSQLDPMGGDGTDKLVSFSSLLGGSQTGK